MIRDEAWEKWWEHQGLDIGNNTTLVSAYKAAMMVAFLAGWTARQRHDAEIARKTKCDDFVHCDCNTAIADAIERSE